MNIKPAKAKLKGKNMEKSYVTMERKICIVCGKEYDTNSLLLDRRLRKQFDRHTTTGYGMCKDCESLRNEGYITLIVIDESKSFRDGDLINTEDVHRTGELIHMKSSIFNSLFKDSKKEATTGGVVFISQELAKMIKKNMKEASNENG